MRRAHTKNYAGIQRSGGFFSLSNRKDYIKRRKIGKRFYYIIIQAPDTFLVPSCWRCRM